MKVIVAGSRSIQNRQDVFRAIDKSPFDLGEIVSGMASGPDSYAIEFAEVLGIPYKTFPAKWKELGKQAGFIRNREMADYADALVAVWDGQSNGTRHMIGTMFKLKKPVYVVFSS